MSDLRERREVFYTGHVQGVGFRYSTQRLAEGFEISGWVRNLADGRVQVVVEGDKPELDRFLRLLETEMSQYIGDTERHVRPATSEFSGFEIRR